MNKPDVCLPEFELDSLCCQVRIELLNCGGERHLRTKDGLDSLEISTAVPIVSCCSTLTERDSSFDWCLPPFVVSVLAVLKAALVMLMS